MNELIDRYVMAVAANLPKRERDDVPAELRDILCSKAEAKEDELGRRLTRCEVEDMLRAYGHPLVVAASYGRNQALIGPSVYPFYIFTLKLVGGIMLAIYLVRLAIIAVAGAPSVEPDPELSTALFAVGGVITLVFALIERFGKPEKLATTWRISQLPKLGAPAGRRAFEILFEMAAVGAAILWWVGLLQVPAPTPGFLDLHLAPVWQTLHWPILAYLVLQLAVDLFELAAPGMARVHAALRVGYHLLGLALVAVLYQAGHWIDVTVSLPDRAELAQRLTANFDRGFRIGLIVSVFIFLFEAGRAGLRLVRYQRLARMQAG